MTRHLNPIAAVSGLVFGRLLLAAMLAISGPALAQTQGQTQERTKVVYHMVDGIDQASRGLGNIRNHLRADPQAKIVVVALGDGIKFLLNDARERNGKPFDAAVAALAEQGVEFRICNNTLTAHDVPVSQVVPTAKLVQAGVAEIARLQAREGFVYIRP